MSNLKSCPDCGHKVSPSAPTCPNCGRVNPGGNGTNTIDGSLWRFFGILFLLFVLFNALRGYNESTRDELGESLDRLEQRTSASLEKIRKAAGEPIPTEHEP
jgi:hypothetical protein